MYIEVNGIKLYYEEYGNGTPIVLLHGNGENHKIFSKLIGKLKNTYKIYAIDSRCHGKSENPNEISYDLMADDVISFIKKLNIEKPILYGFSDGGNIGLEIAVKEPLLLSKLIISGANLNPKGLTTAALALYSLRYFLTRNKLYKMVIEEPDISTEELHGIQIPVCVLAGERDIVRYTHTELIAENIKNCTLEIIPGENHGSYIVNSEKLYPIIRKYL